MTVNCRHSPTSSFKAFDLVCFVSHIERAIDCDIVIVPEHDQLVELHVTCKRNRFLADAFHEAAIASDHPGVVVDNIITEFCIQMTLSDRHTDSRCDTLTEWAGCCLYAFSHEVLRMARSSRAKLAEVFNIAQRNALISCQIQERVDEHGAVAR